MAESPVDTELDVDSVDATDDAGREAPVVAAQRAWWRGLPMVVVLVGVLAFGALAVVCRTLADQNEQHLLQEQTDQAGAVLTVSIGQVQAPLDGAVRAAAATGGDPVTFTRVATPLTTKQNGYRTIVLYQASSSQPIAAVGSPSRLAAPGPTAVDDVLQRARSDAFVVVDLLQRGRVLGYAVRDADAARYVVYAERQLNPNPNERQRNDQPFSQLDYALYLGPREDPTELLTSSVPQLPIAGRRADTVIAFGDQRLLLVTTPIGRLGGRLMSSLWWIVLLGGAIGTATIAILLRRLQRTQNAAVALAADNARKHDEQRRIAETLQRGLLPERLDAPPGALLSARYWPAEDVNLVGGDFYDAFRIDDARWGIVIGDVCGKGIQAAALTGLVRHTLRTAARTSATPSEALHAVHAAMHDHRPATFCTVCFVMHEVVSDGSGDPVRQRLTVALGGHPQPLLARHRQIMPIGQPGTVLGMIEPTITDEHVELSSGDTLVLFTDGLTDAPSRQGLNAEEIAGILRHESGADVDELADMIGELSHTRRPSGSGDDTAILIVRFGPLGARDRTTRPSRDGAEESPQPADATSA